MSESRSDRPGIYSFEGDLTMLRCIQFVIVLVSFAMVFGGCSTAPDSTSDRMELQADAREALDEFRDEDASLDEELDDAEGYAVFPTVGKGGLVVGGAFGRGVVYENGRMIGYAAIKQGTVGAQIGGQSYSELILFEDEHALNRFKGDEFAFAAQASAVAAASGAAANADYKDGVMVFTMGEKGLMAEATVGGQRFTFTSLADVEHDADLRKLDEEVEELDEEVEELREEVKDLDD